MASRRRRTPEDKSFSTFTPEDNMNEETGAMEIFEELVVEAPAQEIQPVEEKIDIPAPKVEEKKKTLIPPPPRKTVLPKKQGSNTQHRNIPRFS